MKKPTAKLEAKQQQTGTLVNKRKKSNKECEKVLRTKSAARIEKHQSEVFVAMMDKLRVDMRNLKNKDVGESNRKDPFEFIKNAQKLSRLRSKSQIGEETDSKERGLGKSKHLQSRSAEPNSIIRNRLASKSVTDQAQNKDEPEQNVLIAKQGV